MNTIRDYIHSEQAKTRTTLRMALLIAVFFIAGIIASFYAPAHAAEEAALSVSLDGTVVKEFTPEELEQLASDEGSEDRSFSSWDNTPSFSISEGISGPTVDAVLEAAGIRDDVRDTGTVSFEGSDGDKAVMTGKQLFGDTRYFYPNGEVVDFTAGSIQECAYRDAAEVGAVISTDADNGYGLYVGQAAPNDINGGLFIKNLSAGGSIDVSTKDAPKCSDAIADPDHGSWRPGKKITIKPAKPEIASGDEMYYYSYGRTSVPDYGSMLYNYGNSEDKVCSPEISDSANNLYIRIRAKCYGMQDSAVKTFTYQPGAALTVIADGSTLKTYDTGEITALKTEGNLKYSGYNSFPTLSFKEVNEYIPVENIIRDAAVSDISSLAPGSVIKFTASDGYGTALTVDQLFGSARYYYPNADKGTDSEGGKVRAEAYEGREEVPAVIDTGKDDTLLFGQIEPNEQNFPEGIKYMLSGGTIEIVSDADDKCLSVSKSLPAGGSVVSPGTKIRFELPAEMDMRDKIFYISDPEDGQEPDGTCDLYNYSPYRYNNSDRPYLPEDLVNSPVLKEPGVHVIAVKVSAYGKTDSDVTELRYFVGSGVKASMKASAASYNSVKLTWKNESNASGYKLYRKEGSGKEKLYKTLNAGTASFTDKSLKTGTSYTYRIAVTGTASDGKEYEFDYSSAVSAKPVLNKPSLKLTAGKKKITLKWSKISGASGYEIYRSTKKSSGYKKIKTITKGSTVSFTNKSLKKGTKYYYKIRSYRKVGSKKVYSSYSAVKYTKAK